jgi:hypothetical protein
VNNVFSNVCRNVQVLNPKFKPVAISPLGEFISSLGLWWTFGVSDGFKKSMDKQ